MASHRQAMTAATAASRDEAERAISEDGNSGRGRDMGGAPIEVLLSTD
jgi:hypothetical protein